jgi:hypothetical protein
MSHPTIPPTSSSTSLERVPPSDLYPSEVDRMREIVAPETPYVTRVRKHIGDDIDLKKEVLILVLTTSVPGVVALLLGGLVGGYWRSWRPPHDAHHHVFHSLGVCVGCNG